MCLMWRPFCVLLGLSFPIVSFPPQPLINNGENDSFMLKDIFSWNEMQLSRIKLKEHTSIVTRTRVVCFQGLWGQDEAPSRERMIHLRMRKSFWRHGCASMKHRISEKEVKYR